MAMKTIGISDKNYKGCDKKVYIGGIADINKDLINGWNRLDLDKIVEDNPNWREMDTLYEILDGDSPNWGYINDNDVVIEILEEYDTHFAVTLREGYLITRSELIRKINGQDGGILKL